ncbi:MAG: hypothetical protein Q8M24_08760 [Pseudolabrys sp.]|nr:hypothetical protein [Pseudolabrys sp.]MDP2295537.1 hypothetical protein [Pseudolabrys sp.]
MADAALIASLCDIEDQDRFVHAAMRCATANGIALTEPSIRQAIQPDPVNVARFTPRPPDGATWPPRHWLPVHVTPWGDQIFVDWAHVGAAPLTDPFFEGSIRRAARRPFNRMFRYRMTLEDFIADAPRQPSLPSDGFIFHMSRCGSTLVSQMLAAIPDNIVVSEAAPIDAAVQMCRASPHLDAQAHAALLAAMIAAYGRARGGNERHFFVKLDCWHALALPLFKRAFPATPWLFLYRDPVEVLVSHVRQRGSQMVPDLTPAALYGIDDFDGVPNEDYCARVLGRICNAAAEHLGDGSGLAVNYRELPDAVQSRILPHFAVAITADDDATMTRAARQDAKTPQMEFTGDSAGKQRDAKPALRALAESHLAEVYRRLETLNTAT